MRAKSPLLDRLDAENTPSAIHKPGQLRLPKGPHSAPHPPLSDRTNVARKPLVTFTEDGGLLIEDSKTGAALRELKSALSFALDENRELHEQVGQLRKECEGYRVQVEEARVLRALYDAIKDDTKPGGIDAEASTDG